MGQGHLVKFDGFTFQIETITSQFIRHGSCIKTFVNINIKLMLHYKTVFLLLLLFFQEGRGLGDFGDTTVNINKVIEYFSQ